MIRPLRRGSRLAREWVIVALLALAGLVVLSLTGWDQRWNYVAYDAMVRSSAADKSADGDVLIVAIDKRSLDEIGRWPWKREIHAELLRQLNAGSARSVLFDVLFLEPSPGDAALAGAMQEAGNVSVPYRIASPALNGAPYALEPPVQPIADAAATSGHAMITPDDDGVVRRIDRMYRVAYGAWPHVAIATAHEFDDTLPSGPAAASSSDTNKRRTWAITGPDRALLGFAAPPDGLPTISAAAVIKGEVPRELVAGRDVLIGSMAAGLGDYYATPFGQERQLMRGVELSANAMLAERSGAWITPLNQIWALVLFGPVMVIALIAFVRVRAQSALILTVAAIVTIFAISVGLFYGGYWLGPMGAATVMALTGLAWAWRRLALVDDVLGEELVRLGAYPETTPPPNGEPAEPRGPAFSDPLNERIGLLRQTLSRMRDATLSLELVIDNLPDPTLVISSKGEVIRANRGMAALSEELAAAAGSEEDRVPSQNAGNLTASTELAIGQSGGSRSEIHAAGGDMQAAGEQISAMPRSYQDLLHLFQAVGANAISKLPSPENLSEADNVPALPSEPLELITADQRHFLAASEQVPGRGVAVVSFVEITALRRAMRERERALQFLSHDLRAPIAAGISYLNRLSSGDEGEEAAANTKGEIEAIFGEARRHMQRALDLASSYVLLVKAEEAGARSDTFDIVACLEEAMDTLWPMARDKQVTIVGDFADHEVLVIGDRSAILRSIENLLRNAIEHTDPGMGAIRLALREEGRNITISVIDHDDASAHRVSEAIAAYRHSGNFGAGAGLGLAYCVAVARRHGGAVSVEQSEGEKAVSLTLPRAQ